MDIHKVKIEDLPLNKEVLGISDEHIWIGWFEIVDDRPMFFTDSVKLRSITHYIFTEDILKLTK